MHKLTPEREAEIRAREQAATADDWIEFFPMTYDCDSMSGVGGYEWDREEDRTFCAHARQDIPALLAELDRIRPEWVPVAAGQHRYGHTYDLAGTTQASPVPVWLGKGHYDAQWDRWVDANDLKPFPATTTITHILKTLTPPQLIGQPKL